MSTSQIDQISHELLVAMGIIQTRKTYPLKILVVPPMGMTLVCIKEVQIFGASQGHIYVEIGQANMNNKQT